MNYLDKVRKDRTTGIFCRSVLNEFSRNFKSSCGSKSVKFVWLLLYREDLVVFAVGGAADVDDIHKFY